MIARIDPIPCSLESILHQSPEGRKGGVDWLISGIPHCHEPHAQRLSGVLKDRPSRQRRLSLAPLAMQQSPRRHPRLAGPSAMRADESVRPAQASDRLAASSVAAEPLVNFLKGPWVINSRDKVTGVLHPPRLPSGPTGVKRIPYFANFIDVLPLSGSAPRAKPR